MIAMTSMNLCRNMIRTVSSKTVVLNYLSFGSIFVIIFVFISICNGKSILKHRSIHLIFFTDLFNIMNDAWIDFHVEIYFLTILSLVKLIRIVQDVHIDIPNVLLSHVYIELV